MNKTKGILILAASIGISFFNANSMAVYWDGNTGCIVDTEIVIPQLVDANMASMISHINDINNVGARKIEMCFQPSGSTRGVGKIMIYW